MKELLPKRVGVAFAVFFVVVLAPMTAFADLKVVATVGDFGAMAEEILEDDGEVVTLVRSGEDPHFVDPRPSFARHLNEADLVAYVGLELEEGWLPTLITQARNSDIRRGQPGHFDASNYIQPRDVPAGDVDRSMGDVHPGGNPHYNMDPRQMARVAMAFGDRLAEIEPSMAEEFEQRSRQFARECIRFAQQWEEQFAELPEEARQLISYHDAWTYVAHWLDLEVPIEMEPSPGVPPSPSHVSDVIDVVENRDVGVIAQLAYYPTENAEAVAGRADRDVEVLSVAAQADEGQEYLEHLEEEIVQPVYDAIRQIHDVDLDG